MNECCGFTGKLFGHKFETFLTKEKYDPPLTMNLHYIAGQKNILDFMESQRNVYEIRCKRCGLRGDKLCQNG